MRGRWVDVRKKKTLLGRRAQKVASERKLCPNSLSLFQKTEIELFFLKELEQVQRKRTGHNWNCDTSAKILSPPKKMSPDYSVRTEIGDRSQ